MRTRLALVCALAACTRPRAPAPPGDDPGAARVHEAGAVLKTGLIGAGKPRQASYVLVDVENLSSVDRLVTVSGTLRDDAGADLAALTADEIRVPAHGRRTFALVAGKPVPAARRAALHVDDAVPADYPPQVEILDAHVTHGDLTIATAVARNAIDRDVTAVVAAAFHDAAGRILARPFTIVSLPIGARRQLRFEGPKAAATAVVFVAQQAFH